MASTVGQKLRDQIGAVAIEKLADGEKTNLLASYGTLAPSTHNTQPWLVEAGVSELKIYIDKSRAVPAADPTLRDMYISLGALIKNVELAAKEFGVKSSLKLARPLADSELVATFNFFNLDQAKSPQQSEILEGILKRQNYRGFFKIEFDEIAFNKIMKETLAGQQTVRAKVITEKTEIVKLAKLTAKGLKMAYADPMFRHEIGSLINHNLSRKKYGLHGYSLRLSTLQSFVIPEVMKRKDIGPKLAMLNYKSFILSPAAVVLATDKDDETSWLATGQTMEEVMVCLAAAGLTSSIYTASIESKGLREELMRILGITKKPLPQVLFCVGTPGAPLPFSVRKDLAKVSK